jgi:hypothetical protein
VTIAISRPRIASLAVTAVLAVGACSGGHPSARSRAASLCERSLHRHIVSSSATTVGDVRALAGGPLGAHIAADAFPGAPPTAFAAWCWTASRTTFEAYAVTKGFRPRGVAGYERTAGTPTPSGPPIIK